MSTDDGFPDVPKPYQEPGAERGDDVEAGFTKDGYTRSAEFAEFLDGLNDGQLHELALDAFVTIALRKDSGLKDQLRAAQQAMEFAENPLAMLLSMVGGPEGGVGVVELGPDGVQSVQGDVPEDFLAEIEEAVGRRDEDEPATS